MAHINLLPWREELRKQKQREFAFITAGAVILAGLIVLMSHIHVDGLISDQKRRNTYLEGEISILNQRIKKIADLEAMKADLLARMNVIQALQRSRPESVHLMDDLVHTLPDGVHLTKFNQREKNLTMSGVAQSNARVSDYMRNIDGSAWLSNPRLELIQAQEIERRRVANFTLKAKQKSALSDINDNQEDAGS
jgi:type IV pilus assembly protein PilN